MNAQTLETDATRSLAEAIGLAGALHEAGRRAEYRRLLEDAIDRASRARSTPAALSTLAKAHALRAEDALHGAGQLSLSAQRAPTREACDEGWLRVEAIVRNAESSAREAALVVAELDALGPARAVARATHAAADRARAAALAARRLVDERNHAYTFHADAGFSFGEGWYLAAAATLDDVVLQIEPGKPGTPQVERFVRDADLGHAVRPYRARPRAAKHLPDIVARAFRRDPLAAQARLRAAFLGDEPIARALVDWIDPRLAGEPDREKALVWIRDGAHHPNRNTAYPELVELVARVQRAGLVPILVGDALRGGPIPAGAVDMILFWKDPIFRGVDTRRAQLQFFEHLRRAHGVVGQLGVTTAGMDGPALLGLPTAYLTAETNVRMRAWVGAVPGYREIVRERGYLERVEGVLREWASQRG